jgi:hypothetical protein
MPFPAITEPLKAVGLFFFRAEWMIRIVFWIAVIAHVYEGFLGFKFARRVLEGSSGIKQTPFVLFWFIQTLLVGYPSLRLLKEQRREQLAELKSKKAAASAGKTATD